MKQIIMLIGASMALNIVIAQEQDTTKTEPKPVVRDTIPQPTTTTPAEVDGAPKIIYYKSNDTERRKEKRRDIKTLS